MQVGRSNAGGPIQVCTDQSKLIANSLVKEIQQLLQLFCQTDALSLHLDVAGEYLRERAETRTRKKLRARSTAYPARISPLTTAARSLHDVEIACRMNFLEDARTPCGSSGRSIEIPCYSLVIQHHSASKGSGDTQCASARSMFSAS